MLTDTQLLLSSAGYHCQPSLELRDAVQFEDESLFGFVAFYDDGRELLSRWRADKDTFLIKHAGAMRTGAPKAWNCYAIFLTSEAVDAQQRVELWRVEEDFSGCRKIARDDVRTAENLKDALAPLIPPEHVTTLPRAPQLADVVMRLSSLPEDVRRSLSGPADAATLAEFIIQES